MKITEQSLQGGLSMLVFTLITVTVLLWIAEEIDNYSRKKRSGKP